MVPQQKPGRSEQTVVTPQEFIQATCRKLGIQGFAWDLAADVLNAQALNFFTVQQDALALIWPRSDRDWNWLNPPYSDITAWVQRAHAQGILGARTVVLVPAGIGSNWWRDWVDGKARVLALNGRITFVGHTAGYPKDLCLLLYGPDQVPGYEVWNWKLSQEEKQMAKKRVGKAEKAPKVRTMTARKDRQAKPDDEVQERADGGGFGRITTFTPNGSQTMEPAPDVPSVDLGPILLPSPDDAVKVLAELAALNDRALAAKTVYDTLKERTKAAREKYDDLAEQVITRLRISTHASDLPLFEAQEEDLARMVGAAHADQAENENGSAEPVAGAPLSDSEVQASTLADADEVPF